ncbi:LuxR C-terminal-related transcriptional regulator [Malikia sp.]|uniref:response regulator transcription factor n=1 Tax=Malikia sp. TaxID=2070706 RepID=UPI0026071D85|nr:LuxR C-terminal-related transcriptional regulator [Malikia sp.]MDD2729782.1 LuxR C-terminal-related transcriptional regulator [Malikia sp.]
MAKDGTVFLIDDDDAVRDSLGWLLRTRRLLSIPYASADAFWAEAQGWREGPGSPCCALLDLRMPGMSGLALFERLREQPWFTQLPVIFLSGHADVPTAVDAVLRGAFDFCEKPFSDNALVARIERALEQSAEALAQRQRQRDLLLRIAGLTEREQTVMQLVAAGMPNKLVADQLGISVRTVEVHRARIFDKMGVKSVVELVRLQQQD